MATSSFRYPFDIQSTLEPWRHELGHSFDDVVAHLSDRDRALENYVSGTGNPSPTAPLLGDRVQFLLNPPACRVSRNINQTLNTGVEASIAWTGFRWDNNNFNNNTTKITFNTAGLYTVTFNGSFPTNGTGERYFYFRLNGATALASTSWDPGQIVTNNDTCIATIWKFAAGDYIEVQAFQTSGGNLDVLSLGDNSPEVSATWIGTGN